MIKPDLAEGNSEEIDDSHSLTSATSLRRNAAEPGVVASADCGENAVVTSCEDEPGLTAPARKQLLKKPFYKKRWFIVSQIIIIPLGIALLFIILFPVIRALVHLVLKRSTLDIHAATISNPTNSSFQLSLEGNVAHAGIFPVTIEFTNAVNVSWVEPDGTITPLGNMNMNKLYVKHKRAIISQSQPFTITDEATFGRFARALITSQNFTWRLQSRGLHVQALMFPKVKGIEFSKDLVLQGFNSFNGNVLLEDFQLPRDNAAGGIDFVARILLTNPSPFSLDLGTVAFALNYQNYYLGMGASTTTTIAPGAVNHITLAGILRPPPNAVDLAIVSQLFTNYINNELSAVVATGESTMQSDGSTVSWLSSGLKSLNLDVPFKPFVSINPIRAISIGDLALQFDEGLPWNPKAESNSVQANLQLPFGFSISIDGIQNDFTIAVKDSAVVGLSTPVGASISSITVINETSTVGTIYININDTRFSCPQSQHDDFSAFNSELIRLDVVDFQLSGNSRAIAHTNLGAITLDPIKVNVTTHLNGFQGLKGMSTIDSVDVTGGISEGINLAIQVTIYNPSNLILDIGDLTLHLSRENVVLGTALLSNLTLQMGNNTIFMSSIFDVNGSPQGQQTLNDFLGKKDVQLTISGFSGSTQVASLEEAFQALQFNVTLPGLMTDLLDAAQLQVLSTTGTVNNISRVTVSLANPFSASLQINKVSSIITAFGIPLGVIDTLTNFTADPKSTTVSPSLDLLLNFDPAALFTVTRALAIEAGLNVIPLDEIMRLGGIQYLTTPGTESVFSTVNIRQSSLFDGFNLPSFVDAAFKFLKSDIQLASALTIGDYSTNLHYTQSSLETNTDKTLAYILPVLAQPIVQKIVSSSILGIDSLVISDPQQESFTTRLKGSVVNAGPFDAKLSFPSGLYVGWRGKRLGTLNLGTLQITADIGADINDESQFQILDVTLLTEFVKVLLTEESFEWDISGDNLTVSALGIDVTGVSLPSKIISLKGFNGLMNGISIQTFDLPFNDPAGGIHLTLDVSVINPSQVGIEMNSIGFETFVGNVMIAPVTSEGTVSLFPKAMSKLSLFGRLLPQNSSEGLAAVSGIFNNFLHGRDSDVIVHGSLADVTWLADGIRALQVATILPNKGSLDIIKSINLDQLEMIFSPDMAFNPLTSSSSTTIVFTPPFDFPLDIISLEQTINITFGDSTVGQLVIAEGPTVTDIEDKAIHLTFKDIPFAVSTNSHSREVFSEFIAATTLGGTQTLRLSGIANANAETAVGLLSLTDIGFAVDSNIEGLQGLTVKPITITNLDVRYGYVDYLLIQVNSSLYNPSNLTIGTGDVSFSLNFQSHPIGSADISNLIIVPGSASYPINVRMSPQEGASNAVQALLENFIEGSSVELSISGTPDSTSVESLKLALSQINLSPVTIPGLNSTLINSAAIIFPPDIVQTGVALTSFMLSNPFTASINLLKLKAVATFHGLTLGTITSSNDVSTSFFTVAGHNTLISPNLPIAFNLDPAAIIQVLLYTSQSTGTRLGPLASIFEDITSDPTFKPPVSTSVDTEAPTCVSGKQFDVAGAILSSLKGLKVDLAIEATLKLDQFETELLFDQRSIPVMMDTTALYLIGAVAAPAAQLLVDRSILTLTSAFISNIEDSGFSLSFKGSLTNIGPLDALITFVEPLSATFQGTKIAEISLPPICAAATFGVPDYEAEGQLVITDSTAFANFATSLLHDSSFEWTIATSKLRITSLGTVFDNLSLSKTISFEGFNGFQGITISNFKLPSDDSAGGIHIETDVLIPSTAQLGVDLGVYTLQTYFEGTLIGSLEGTDLNLMPKADISSHLSGRIVPQSGSGLDNLGILFSHYLAGVNQTLVARGDSIQPPGASQPVAWLSNAFKTLSLNVILPGKTLTVIESILLNDLEVTIETQEQTFAPPTSSVATLARYINPFGFSLQVVEAGQTIVLSSHGTDVAQLDVPKTTAIGGVSTGNLADLQISFQNIPLQALSNVAFQQLLAGVTDLSSTSIDISGFANVTARTSIGDIPIDGIPFHVASSLLGMDAFGHTVTLSGLEVTGSGGGGGSEYIVAQLTTTLQNPSNISLNTIDVSLPVYYEGVTIGRAAISNFGLVPGGNSIQSEFHYKPDDANNTMAQSFLTKFIQTGNPIDLVIHGDAASSPFQSLSPALSALQLTTHLDGLNQPTLITNIEVIISPASILTGEVEVNFNVYNPLNVELVLEYVQSDASVGGTIYAKFAQNFDNFVVPPGSTVNSGTFGNVLLTKGVISSLGIVPLGKLDIAAATTIRFGSGGYQVPFLKIQQDAVPTTYVVGISASDLQHASKHIPSSTSLTSTLGVISLSDGVSTIIQTASSVASSADSVASTVESLALPFLSKRTA